MPLLPLSVCSGPSTEAISSRRRALALQAQQHRVEDGELLAGVLEVDRTSSSETSNSISGEPGATPGFTDR